MKKMFCLILATVLCFSAGGAVSADTPESETVAKLILTAKDKLAISDEIMEFSNYYFHETEDEGTLYTLDWETKDENTYGGISVTLNEEGIISRYSLHEDKPDTKPSFSKYTREEALQAAKDFIAGIDPDKLAKTGEPEVTRSYGSMYSVAFPRMQNGIPVAGNTLRCTVDSNSLKITEYAANWQNNLTFAEGEPITAEEATQAYAEHIGYELFYQIKSEDYQNTVTPLYRSRYDEDVMIDALTGEAVTHEQELYRYAAADAAMTMEGSRGSNSKAQLSAIEQALVEEVSAMLSREDADAIARAVPEFGITEAYTLENYSTYRMQTGEYSIGLSYRTENKADEGYSYKSLQLNAATGQVTEYYSGGYIALRTEKEETDPIPKEELQEKANAFMTEYYAEQYAQMTEKPVFTPANASFTYLREVNGIKVYNNTAHLAYNDKTGELTSFSISWTDVPFPAADDAAGVEAANEKALTVGNFRLQYLPLYLEEATQAVPVFALEERPLLYAKTLEELDYRLIVMTNTEVPDTYVDIDGHYGQNRIERLLEHDIFLRAEENRLFPDTPITQQDYFLLLNQVIWQRSYDTDIDYMYRNLIRSGVLAQEEINPHGTVSRMQAVTYLLRALDYGEFIKISGIFKNPFADVPEEAIGPAAVAYGLKLVSGDGQNFYPNTELSRADAMIIVHNYLQY
ncbi:MAG: hypothetical protein E7414_05740 [Ruminococcaceae bacterium]|nr:hypothetical protein [Oscillospiraceae bacterium]